MMPNRKNPLQVGKYVKYADTAKKKDAGKLRAYISEEKLRIFRKLVWF